MQTTLYRRQSHAGFSLIELMIAMTVTLVIAGASATLLAQAFRMRSREDHRSDAIADAQRALNIVSREIANSGFGLVDNGIVPGDTNNQSIRIRANLNDRGATAVIPPKADRVRPIACDFAIYRWRHLVENFFCSLKEFRRIATRYDKTDISFAAAIHLVGAFFALK